MVLKSTYESLEDILDVINEAGLSIVDTVQDYRGNLKLIVEDKK